MAFKLSVISTHKIARRSNFLNLTTAIWLVGCVIVFGIVGFMFIEEYTLLEAFYMTIITLSTVGYTEVRPLTEPGRLFTSVLILINIGVFTYGASAFTYYVVQGEFFRNLYIRSLNKKIAKLKDHMIICGFGRYGTEVAEYFFKHGTPFVILEKDEKRIHDIQHMGRNYFYIQDDATKDDVLLKAGVNKANSIICALPDDTDNLFITLSARQLNPEICIISRSQDVRSMKKLELAGANHVIMPEQIGGYYMATLVQKPNATEFFSFISDDMEHDIGFEEISYESMPAQIRDKTIEQLCIRDETGANIIGYRDPEGRYMVNPPPDVALVPKSSFIVLGNDHQLDKLRKYLLWNK